MSEIRTGTGLMPRVRKFIETWQEPVVWLPVLIVVLLGLFYLLPRLDPRTGIDGFGLLFQLAGALVQLALIFFVAWLAKRTYLTELTADEEAELQVAAMAPGDQEKDQRAAFRVLLLDRLEWAGLLLIAYLVLG